MNTWREELAWCAGFFDGEGYVGALKRGSGTVQVVAPQVDRRVLDRFRTAVRVGTIYGPTLLKGNRQPRYTYRVSDYEGAQAVIAMLWHWLSPVKRAQATAAFAAYRAHDYRPWRGSVCRQGHSRAEHSTTRIVKHKNGRSYVYRKCRLCFREYIRGYMRKQRSNLKLVAGLEDWT